MASTTPPPGLGKTDSYSTSSSNTHTIDRDVAIDLATAHVHETIRSLLADEVPDLANAKGLSVFADPYLNLSMKSFRLYLVFVWNTWWGVGQSARHVLGGHIGEAPSFLI